MLVLWREKGAVGYLKMLVLKRKKQYYFLHIGDDESIGKTEIVVQRQWLQVQKTMSFLKTRRLD